jgi:hypothetical protein
MKRIVPPLGDSMGSPTHNRHGLPSFVLLYELLLQWPPCSRMVFNIVQHCSPLRELNDGD